MINFRYIDGYDTLVYPFRVGDVVKVKDFGETFSDWTEANLHFTKKVDTPFYSTHLGMGERNKNTPFKIKEIMAHPCYSRVVCYLCDRDGHDIIIGAQGLTLVRQYPLRKGESDTITLKKLI